MKTDVGLVRERNEDSAWVDPRGRFVILADGMGGHGAGDVASAMAVDIVRTCLEGAARDLVQLGPPKSRGRGRIRVLLERAIRLANDGIVARSQREADKHQMGTTIDVVVFVGGEAFIAHVGDTRTYLIRHGTARQLTTDHTVYEVMRQAGTLAEGEASSHLRSVLCNAIGVTPGVTVEHAHLVLEEGDRLLVCSDGLYDYFTNEQLAELSAKPDLPSALDELIGEARARGGHDNITGVVIQAGELPVEWLDDVTTNRFEVPRGFVRTPFDQVNEDTLTGIVDAVLRETTQPIRG